MEKTLASLVDNFIENWNRDVPNYRITIASLKDPQALMGALFQIFDRLGIDRDAVLMRPPEESRNENMIYYWDLLPVINMTRVTNHLVSVMPQVPMISITYFLQPTVTTSHSILLLLFNLMLFNEERLRNIEPYEEELFSKTEQVTILENRKNRLLEMLNEQAEEKGKRAERLEKLDYEIKQYEDELKQENEPLEAEKQELEAILKENKQTEIYLEQQKKSQRDALLAEIEKIKELRVYDAEDIKNQAEQAAQNVKEAEEKLNSLQATLMQKTNSLKNLQTIKPTLDTANNLLHDIIKLSESLKDYESGDLQVDSDSKEGELDVLNCEISELEVELAELKVAREEASNKRQESHAKRQQEGTLAQSNLREAEEKDKKCNERSKKASQRVQEIKELTIKYEHEKAKTLEVLNDIKESFTSNLKSIEEALLKKVQESKERIEDKLRNRKI